MLRSNDENLHCQENSTLMYSMYQSYPITSVSNIPNSSLQFYNQQLASSSVCSMLNQDNSNLTSACTMSSLTINDNMSANECHETNNTKSNITISNCENVRNTNVYSSVETLPENFLDDSLISKTTSDDVASDMIWGSNEKKNADICFWDDNNNNSDSGERKNDDLIYSGLSGIPQHIIVSSSSPPPPSNALHNLVTMVCYFFFINLSFTKKKFLCEN